MRSCLTLRKASCSRCRQVISGRASEARLRPPGLPELGREPFLDNTGDLEEEIAATGDSTPRLFYRSTAPVHNMGHIVMYRDVSKEVESEQMKAEILRLRAEHGGGCS